MLFSTFEPVNCANWIQISRKIDTYCIWIVFFICNIELFEAFWKLRHSFKQPFLTNFYSFFYSNLSSEDDIITKIGWDISRRQFLCRFSKTWFWSSCFGKCLNTHFWSVQNHKNDPLINYPGPPFQLSKFNKILFPLTIACIYFIL